jgi:hypothetical protein
MLGLKTTFRRDRTNRLPAKPSFEMSLLNCFE